MSFEEWKVAFLTAAKDKISTKVLAKVAPFMVELQTPKAADKSQPEARKTLKQYLDVAVSDTRIKTGRVKLAELAEPLDDIENRFGVDREIVLAIWGMETNYGAVLGDMSVFATLATLAHQGRRKALFETQLIAACQMIERSVDPATMIGSWAGAMGHTQFMPTSYLDYAVAYDGGTADIWGNPLDGLASAANYLAQHGWQKHLPYAVEVTWPTGMDLYAARNGTSQSLTDWTKQGVVPVVDTQSDATFSFHMPAGHKNPAFLISDNYRCLLKYNNADAYAIGVGHLAHRLAEGDDFKTQWTGDNHGLTLEDTKAAQERLTALGFDTQGADGFPGPNTTRAVEAFQRDRALPVDGCLDWELIKILTA